MRLGIDYGTTRIVVANVDRGNYPVMQFDDTEGDAHAYLPSLIAERDGTLLFGFQAEAAARAGAPVLRSLKRRFASPTTTEATSVRIGSVTTTVAELLTAQLRYVAEKIRAQHGDEPLEAMISVPAHAYCGQRLLTLGAFQRAGFTVLGIMNEPSAAGIEYAHRHAKTLTAQRTRVVVFDFGGGTFDSSVVDISDDGHDVIATRGNNQLGGDDIDLAIFEYCLREADLDESQLSPAQWWDAYEQVRLAKEALSPQSRRFIADMPNGPVVAPVADIYAASAGIVEQTLATMAPLLAEDRGDEPTADTAVPADVAGIYLVGGASQYPAVARALRASFGRRVRRSPYPAASTAIGLAIVADPDSTVQVRDTLSRGVGVFREEESGAVTTFDPIFTPTEPSRTSVTRTYRPAHTIGHYRFVEYTSLDADGTPRGDVIPLAEVRMPFTRELQERYSAKQLRQLPVEPLVHGPLIEETCQMDAMTGDFSVTITDRDTGFTLREQR